MIFRFHCNSTILRSWTLFAFTVSSLVAQGVSGLSTTPYSAPMKAIASKILTLQDQARSVDREYQAILQHMAETTLLSIRVRPEEEALNRYIDVLDKTIRDSRAVESGDPAKAAEAAGKEIVDQLIDFVKVTNPPLAAVLKASAATSDALLDGAKAWVNRREAKDIARLEEADVRDLNTLIEKDREYRTSVPAAGGGEDKTELLPISGVDQEAMKRILNDAEDLNRWLDQGDRAFGNGSDAGARLKAFYDLHPSLEQFREVAKLRSPADEFDQAGGYALLTTPNGYFEAEDEQLRELRSRDARLQGDLRAAKAELTKQRRAYNSETTRQVAVTTDLPEPRKYIPAGWVACECPETHPHAGLLVNGTRYHSPLLRCDRYQ